MVVSRFFKIPIQNNLSGEILAHTKRRSHVLNPSGPGEYMRKQEYEL